MLPFIGMLRALVHGSSKRAVHIARLARRHVQPCSTVAS
jgi:hypothetical protein